MEKIADHIKNIFFYPRSLTGDGNKRTLEYIKSNIINELNIFSYASGNEVYDWKVPSQWMVNDAYIKNCEGKKIVNINDNFMHLINYSCSYKDILSKTELLNNLYYIKDKPDWIPYRTTYYKKDWGFAVPYSLILSEKFKEPFEICIDTELIENGEMFLADSIKKGENNDEIIISTYCCHPNMANDNLSGLIVASKLFEHIKKRNTKFSYRLIIAPETIGTIAYLANNKINGVGGTVVTCVGGNQKLSMKEAYDQDHWINKATRLTLKELTDDDYIIYPFSPDGSDERQFSSPGVRIPTTSIHKSKYYEYEEYHTSADDLRFVTNENLNESLNAYIKWFENIESYSIPVRTNPYCEYQLGKYDLYPKIGGAQFTKNSKNDEDVAKEILDAFRWLMHLSDGKKSNFDIAEISNLKLSIINSAISSMFQKGLLIK